MNYWLVKSEPDAYSWDDFVKLGRDHWDGVRNYAARKHMMAMQTGDLVLFYHSGGAKEVVGIAKVVQEHYPDPTTDDDRWVVVDLVPEKKLDKPVTLQEIKADDRLSGMPLVRIPRLSVQPVEKEEFDIILKKG
ncbi:EVE domain-containing protein [Jiulongibacter sediminis]|jgi:predicted RNA-binding protein with PUA-like domain|uniref:Ubiquinol-cytochrome C reductase n=1 Tax=Jiulongibacter sediminis TaxID=1605367 RepID=A0A0P7C752_9BACT|nr:EVE domain-containing protein [Jiulongibacter sediminis]KPM49296.1 ubiquinol-cytochrome C reductase [Jiulongibacter sediminis]TBX26348.1 ubiquinol-cytochrome C reductase [Jiulongibacter sediminis]